MKLSLIYLAAGNSRRFGENKLLAELDGRPLYRYGLDALKQAAASLDGSAVPRSVDASSCAVPRSVDASGRAVPRSVDAPGCAVSESVDALSRTVPWSVDASGCAVPESSGCPDGRAVDSPRLATEILVVSQYRQILRTAREEGLVPVESPDSVLGMSYSIRAGLARARGEYLLFQAADQPFLLPETIAGLISHTLKSGARAGVIQCMGKNRNPALFHRSLTGELAALEGDQGGRLVIKRHWEEVCVYEADTPEQFRDIDFREDLRKFDVFNPHEK